MRFGVHVSVAGGIDLAPERARALGCRTFQVFVKSNRQWAARPLAPGEIERFRTARDRSGSMPAFAHACYLINLAACDRALRDRSVRTLALELERCGLFGLDGLVVHPGAHCGDGVQTGLDRILRSIERALALAPDAPRLLLEVTAGQGTTIGARLEELRWLLERTDPARVGVCLDTCHLHAAGYLLDRADRVRASLEAIADTIGWERVHAIHLNDSRAPGGSRRDRHAGIGEGTIGRAGFRAFLADARVRALPGILETPKGEGDALDRLNLARLRALAYRRRWPQPPADPLPTGQAR